MQAIILAAGMGKRLKERTQSNTKCMVRVNRTTLIERMLRQLDKRSLSRIIIVTGYERKKLQEHVNMIEVKTPVIFVENPIYDKTNNIYSLSLAKKYLLQENTLLFESDIIFEDAVLDEIIRDKRDSLALVDRYESWMDGTCVRLDSQDRITDFISRKNFDFKNTAGCYKTVNIYKFSREFSETYYVPFLEAYLKALGENEYYEQVLCVIIMLDDVQIRGKRLNGQRWYEIDDEQDLDIASVIFCDNSERVSKLEERYGGYWRFSELLDFCYLVNPYYPPQKMVDEMKASFDKMLMQYPSGININSLLAAKNFSIRKENIVVGNGASELIRAFMSRLQGKTGFIRPAFEEYLNRYDLDDAVIFDVGERDCRYTADDLMEYYRGTDISALVLVNPDNPSGNYIKKADIQRLADWCMEHEITLLLDESFADFSEEPDNTCIRQNILDENPYLYVMKSISKSYGVPGLRIGVLASGDTKMIAELKKDAAIWNINSFAEFYMQIEEKYIKEYAKAMDKFRQERKRFIEELNQLEYLRVLPTQANFVMAELQNGMSAKELVSDILINYNILIKDLSNKMQGRPFIRIAIRNEDDNRILAKALKVCLKKEEKKDV